MMGFTIDYKPKPGGLDAITMRLPMPPDEPATPPFSLSRFTYVQVVRRLHRWPLNHLLNRRQDARVVAEQAPRFLVTIALLVLL